MNLSRRRNTFSGGVSYQQRNNPPHTAPSQNKPLVQDGFSPKNMSSCSNVKKLREFCSQNNLPEPILKTVSIGQGRERTYVCKLKVGEVSGHDPTLRAETQEQAWEHAAALVLDKLHSNVNHVKKSDSCSLSAESNLATLVDRISKILELKPNGLWDSKVEEIYETIYQEKLPNDWFSMARGCDLFDAPNLNAKIIGLAEKFDLPCLSPPQDVFWNIMVTAVDDTDQIWIHFVDSGYSDVLYTMLHDLKNAVQAGAVNFGLHLVHQGTICLARSGDSLARVQILETNDGNALCFKIDSGGKMVISLADLALLPCMCKKVPPQALLVSLHGLESFSNTDPAIVNLLANVLVNRTFTAMYLESDTPKPSLILHEFGQVDGNSINSMLIEEIVNNLYKPGLSDMTCARQVVLSHVTPEMEICVQTQPLLANWLERELKSVCAFSNIFQEESPEQLNEGFCYIVILINEGNKEEPISFRRGLLLGTKRAALCTMANVLLIDSGETMTVPQFRIKNFPPSVIDFVKLLPQATKCIIHSALPAPAFEQLRLAAFGRSTINIRVISLGNDHKLPMVEILL